MWARLLFLLFAVVLFGGAYGFVSVETRLHEQREIDVGDCWPSEPGATPAPRGSVTGFVFDSSGAPLAAAEVQLIPPRVEDEEKVFNQTISEWTDSFGHYELRAPPGDYLLAVQVNAAPDPRLPVIGQFYPGTTSRQKAEVISVKDSQQSSVTAFYLKRIPTVSIDVEVRFADGRVPEYSHVLMHNPRFPRQATIGNTSVSIEHGRGKIVLPVGFEYFVTGKVNCRVGDKIESPESRPVQTIHVTKKAHPESLTLTIDSPACKLWWPD
jgi:hypothetical protein